MPRTSTRTTKRSAPRVYQLQVSIKDIRPLVWRRIRVPGKVIFLQLHDIIQDALGWTDSHLHEFIVDKVHYGNPEDYEEFEADFRYFNEDRSILERVVRRSGKRFSYVYDYGDGWRHCPPEDCGGPWGYAEFLEAIRNPEHERHRELLEWAGGEFNPEEFNLEATNRALALERPMRDHGVGWIQ